jgi:hypothetical protein
LKIILSPILNEVKKIPLEHKSDNVIESGQVAFPANDLLFNSAIILTPEKLNVATKTIGGALHVQPLHEQEQGESFGSPLLGI